MKILDIINEASLRDILPKEKPSSGKVQAPGYTGKGEGRSGSKRRDMRPKGVAIEHPDYVYNMVDSSSPDGIRKLSPGKESWNAWYDHKGSGLTHRRDFTPEQKQQIIRNQELAKKNNSFDLIPKEGESWRTTDGMGKSDAKISNSDDGTNDAFDAHVNKMVAAIEDIHRKTLERTGDESKANRAAEASVDRLVQRAPEEFSSTQRRNLGISARKQSELVQDANALSSGMATGESGTKISSRIAPPALQNIMNSEHDQVKNLGRQEYARRQIIFKETGKVGNAASSDPVVARIRKEADALIKSELERSGEQGTVEDIADQRDKNTVSGLNNNSAGATPAGTKSQQAKAKADAMKSDEVYDAFSIEELKKKANVINSDVKYRARAALKRRGEPYGG